MSDDHWRRIEELFHQAASLAPNDRAIFLSSACAGDDELRRQIESLLANDHSNQYELEAAVARAVDRLPSESANFLAPGIQLGPYKVVALIGRGGMGEVYKAIDTRLNRAVAIKILRAAHTDRFQREARAIAALNHPNICHLYDIGPNYLVMEWIDGTPLTGPLPLDQAIRLACQLASALVAAHFKGIVHRDLKPANIKVTRENSVKVLDFGLAKSVLDPNAASIAATADLTMPGSVMGTPGYMSPEQARGEAVDERADIWAFGCLLYELLTGQRAFQGKSFAEQVASVLTQEPDWSLIPTDAPGGLRSILRRCLAKDAANRYRSTEDLQDEIIEIARTAKLPENSGRASSTTVRAPLWPRVLGAASILALICATAIFWMTRRRAPQSYPLKQITFEANVAREPALSPDGRLLAYASDRGSQNQFDIWVKQLPGGEPVRLTSGFGSKSNPQFSTDGTKIYYLQRDDLYQIPALGGEPRKLFEHAGPFVVSSHNEIAFYRPGTGLSPSPITIISAEGVNPEIWRPECVSLGRPTWSPDGGQLAFAGECGTAKPAILVAPRRGGSVRSILPSSADQVGSRLTWFRLRGGAEGLLFSTRSADTTNLFRVSMDGAQQQVTFGTGSETAAVVSPAGDLIFTRSETSTAIWSLPLNSNDARPVRETAPGSLFAISRDGSRLVYGRMLGAARCELVLRNRKTGAETVLAQHDVILGGYGSLWPQVSPDGERIIYRTASESSGESRATVGEKTFRFKLSDDIYLLSVGGGAPRLLPSSAFALATDWRPDGKRVIGECTVFSGGICELDPSSGKARLLLENPPGEQLLYPSFSWDGLWVAFMERRGGRTVITLAPVSQDGRPAAEGKWIRVSSDKANASRPRFAPDGSSIFYLMSAPSSGFTSSSGPGGVVLVRQKLDPLRKTPVGKLDILSAGPFSGPGVALISVSRDRVFFNTTELRSNLWMTRLR